MFRTQAVISKAETTWHSSTIKNQTFFLKIQWRKMWGDFFFPLGQLFYRCWFHGIVKPFEVGQPTNVINQSSILHSTLKHNFVNHTLLSTPSPQFWSSYNLLSQELWIINHNEEFIQFSKALWKREKMASWRCIKKKPAKSITFPFIHDFCR